MKHRAQSLRQFLRAWHFVRNPCLSNLCLRAHDALGERCRRNEKCPRNLLSSQAADFAQCERNLSFRRQGGMTASEDQTESIVFDLLLIDGSFVDARFHIERKISLCSVEACAPAHPIDSLEACR